MKKKGKKKGGKPYPNIYLPAVQISKTEFERLYPREARLVDQRIKAVANQIDGGEVKTY